MLGEKSFLWMVFKIIVLNERLFGKKSRKKLIKKMFTVLCLFTGQSSTGRGASGPFPVAPPISRHWRVQQLMSVAFLQARKRTRQTMSAFYFSFSHGWPRAGRLSRPRSRRFDKQEAASRFPRTCTMATRAVRRFDTKDSRSGLNGAGKYTRARDERGSEIKYRLQTVKSRTRYTL